jgi:hypothetical protein
MLPPINERLDTIITEPMPVVDTDPNNPPLITQEDLDNAPTLTYEPGEINMEDGVQVAGLFGSAADIIRKTIKQTPQKTERTLVPEAARQAPGELPVTRDVGDKTLIPAAQPELAEKVQKAVELRTETGAVDGLPPSEAFNLSRYQTDDAAAIVGGVSDALGIKTVSVTFDEIKSKAAEMGIDEKFIARLTDQNGQMMPNAVDTYRALQVLESSANELDRLFKLVSTAGKNIGDPMATEAERLQLRQQIALHGMIQRGVKGMQTETARALAVFRIPRDGSVDAIRNVLDEYGGDKSLSDMANAYLMLDRSNRNKMIEKSMLSSVKDVWFTTFMNGLLSSGVTHAKNIASGIGFGAYQIPERLVASLYSNLLPKGVRDWKALVPGSSEDKIAYDEALIMSQSIVQGTKRGFEWASTAFKNNLPNDPYSKIEAVRGSQTDVPPISSAAFGMSGDTWLGKGIDYYGRAVTMPGRLLLTEDEFFKGKLYQMNLNALIARDAQKTYRLGLAEGLDEIDAIARAEARTVDITSNVPADLDEQAMEFARRGTFTNKLPPNLEKLQEVFSHPLLKILVPFFKTPANIGLEVIERTPFAPISSRWRADLAAGGPSRDMAMAKISLGSTFLATYAGFAAEGHVSGRGPARRDEREALERTGWKPYSIKVGDEWFSYAGLEPVSALMAIAADYAEYAKYEPDATKIEEVFLGGIFATYHYLSEQPYMQGVADVGKLVGDADSSKVKAGINAIAKQYGGFVIGGTPMGAFNSLVAGIERLTDPTKKDVKADPDLPMAVKGFYEAFNNYRARLPYMNDSLPNDLNMWGDMKTDGQGKGYEMILPTRVSPEQFSPADDILVRLGGPIGVKSFNRIDGVELTGEQRNRFKEIYGKEIMVGGLGIKDTIVEMANNPGFSLLPLDAQQKNIKNIHELFTAAAKDQLIMEMPEISQRIEKLKANREAFGLYYKE